MFDEILKSAKTQINERVTSPLIGSFAISWCLWNYKFLVILFSNASISHTFLLLDTVAFPTTWSLVSRGIFLPGLTAAAYIFVYPYPAKFVYEFTRRRQKEINEVRQRIEDETLLTIEESRKIRAEVFQAEKDHQEKIDRLNVEISRLKQELANVQVEPSAEQSSTDTPTAQPLAQTQLALLRVLETSGGKRDEQGLIRSSNESKIKTEFDLGELVKLELINKRYNQGIGDYEYEFLQEGRRILLENANRSINESASIDPSPVVLSAPRA